MAAIQKKRMALSLALGAFLALGLTSVALATHPRPGGGTPLRVPLVPVFKACGDDETPNTTHTAPLTVPSCSPTSLSSPVLTTGVAGQMNASMRLDVFCTNAELPPCPAAGDQMDQRITVSATDVRCAVGAIPGCTAPAADYTGQLIARLGLRITGHANPTVCAVPSGAGCTTASTRWVAFGVPVSCTATPTSAGATCSLNTTFNSHLPGVIKEGQRELQMAGEPIPGVDVSLEQVPGGIIVQDAGPDGDVGGGSGTGDETAFLSTGTFLP